MALEAGLQMESASDLSVEIVERKDDPGTWSVEIIDYGNDGACYVNLFTGPDSKARAEEYAHLKFGR